MQKKINDNCYSYVLSGACKNNKADEIKRQNVERKLSKKLNRKVHVLLKYKNNAMQRSHIPAKLITDILQQFLDSKSKKKTKNNFSFNKKVSTKWSETSPTRKKMLSYGTI